MRKVKELTKHEEKKIIMNLESVLRILEGNQENLCDSENYYKIKELQDDIEYSLNSLVRCITLE